MLEGLTGWHWLTLGIGLLLLEVLGIGGVLIGVGTAAIVTALIVSLIALAWQIQLVVFGVLSIIATTVFWRFFRVNHVENATSKLNNRMAALVGIKASLLMPVVGGRGKIQVQDALWTVACDVDLPEGTLIEVVGYQETTLNVIKVEKL